MKSSPPANIKEFGAVGDGITDDTAAIEAAIAAIPDTEQYWLQGGKTGGILRIPLANFCISRQIEITKSGIQIIGVGSNSSVISPTEDFVGDSALYFRKEGSSYPFTGLNISNIGVYF